MPAWLNLTLVGRERRDIERGLMGSDLRPAWVQILPRWLANRVTPTNAFNFPLGPQRSHLFIGDDDIHIIIILMVTKVLMSTVSHQFPFLTVTMEGRSVLIPE